MRLSDDKLIPQYKQLTDIVHKDNCPILAQLALGAFYNNDGVEINPDDMTLEDIKTAGYQASIEEKDNCNSYQIIINIQK